MHEYLYFLPLLHLWQVECGGRNARPPRRARLQTALYRRPRLLFVFGGGALAPCIRVSLGVRRHDKPDLRACLGDTRKNTLFTFFLVTSPVEKHVSHSYKLQVICPHNGTAALSGLRPDCSYLS